MTPTLERFSHARTTNFAPLLFCLAALLAGCGGSDTGGGGGGNQPPVATAACSFTPLNTVFTDRLDASDPNNDALTYTIVQQGTLGHAETDVAGNYRYTPNFGARGKDSFVFRVTDSAGNQATGTVDLIVGHTRIMPLGDSITQGVTIGAGCSGTSGDPNDPNCPPVGERVGYRKFLYDQLTATGYHVQLVGSLANGSDSGLVSPNDQHEGHGAFSTAQIRDGLASWLSAATPDIVLLHAGTNDANNANGGNPDGAALADTSNSILQRIYAANPQTTVLVAKIVGSPNLTINASIGAFNADVEARINAAWATQVAAGRLILVDMYNALADRQVGGDFADNLHPNNTGYQKMGSAWLTRLTAGNLLPRCP